MSKFWKLSFALAATAGILACSLVTSANEPALPTAMQLPTPGDTAAAPAPLDTPTAAQTSAPASSGMPVSFANVSLIIPEGLASGATTETVPAGSEGPAGSSPAFNRFTLQGYPLQDKRFEPQVMIYPAQDYAALSQGAQISIGRLQAINSDPSTPLTKDTLPILPSAMAAQMIVSQATRLQIQSGNGVRIVTQYGQAAGPITNYDLFYHYEGLTSDGKYYVIATLPVNVPFLADSYDSNAPLPPGGIPAPDFSAQAPDFDAYFQAVAAQLNSTPGSSFTPSLDLLDALIGSINVSG